MPVGQLLIDGLAMGACYGLFGLAVVIIYKTSEVLNFAAGEMAMVSTFVAYHVLVIYGYSFWVAFVIALIFAAFLGVFVEYFFLRPAKNPTLLGLIVITIGAQMLLMGLASWKWGAEQKQFSIPFSYKVTYEPISGFIVSQWAIAVFVAAAAVMVFLYFFFQHTKMGTAMRATQQNKHAAKIMGIKTDRVFAFAWAFSSIIGAVAAMLLTAKSILDPNFMMESFLRAFASAVLGGLMSIPGVLIGGFIMGLIENFFGFIWPAWKPITAFVVIVLVLCVRPSGLFAKHYVKKV
ncbi:MAG TPA: branched-chain amino acid ABC transporter permease [Smithellaceae bacterium]|jgi:branched-chain amino acid transport system permease protein|nr:branched-chain amino acid ABC transporter permease [Syntrophaceae bacterium]MDX9816348.1 branched-chain amino acid ABC transporter permease [Smithellaceae bacterium]NMD05465.1 branched-chain amino acid ABC transporter permease [Deltaproteobacteria bacterium]HOX99616.1 branched-chain amino acid ABC transporter permease [Smithella sp.]HPM21874.1 branched-chain amino acid ABC transporter permease [Thermotogota bacterium]